MKKIFKNMSLAVVALLIVSNLTGCGGSEDIQTSNPVNIAFAVGIADDETRFNDSIAELSTLPDKPGTDYAFISVESVPNTIGDGTIPDLSDRGYTKVMMDRVRDGVETDLTNRLESYEPVSPEIDIAAATELAVRTLNAHAVEGRENILVFYCSGKSTDGLINMLETPLYELDVENSVYSVAQKMNVDMSSIDIVWYCCGDLGTAQPKLSANEKAHMRSFYEQLFLALGAKSVTFKENLPSNDCYHFAEAPVSCMPVEGTVSALMDLTILKPEIFEDVEETALESPIVIPEEQVSYKPDSAEFIDPDSALMTIQPVADFLLEHPKVNVLLYGTCAGESDSEYTLWLGKARAESVKTALVEAGVNANRIVAVTVKVADDPYYQFGLGTGAEASVNRKTVIIDMSTELAQQIMSNAI